MAIQNRRFNMIKEWQRPTAILANLLIQPCCGEILKRFIKAYNDKSEIRLLSFMFP